MIDLVPAVQMFTLRDYIQTPEGLAESIRRVREEIGCDTVQFSRVGPSIPADFITSVVKEYDMKVCVTHSPMQRIFHDLPALIKEHQAWGCPQVGLGNLENCYLDDGYEGYRRFIADIAPVVEELKKNGMTFAYHSHTFEFVQYHGRRMYDMLVEDTDPEGFHFIQDSFWMKYGGLPHEKYMEKVAGRMEVLHVKDFTPMLIGPLGRVAGETGTIGEGNIYYPPLLQAAARTGVQVVAIEQDRCQRDPFACLKDAYGELKRMIAELEPEKGGEQA